MVTKVTIKNLSNEILQVAIFEEGQTKNEFIQLIAANATFGHPERTITVEPAEYDEEGNEVTPAITQIIPADYVVEEEDVTEEYETKALREEMKAKGAHARKLCVDCLDVIAGFNIDRTLTAEQITQMQQTFGVIEAYLKANRPWSAKPLIQALNPDGVLVTQEMKDAALAVLEG